MRIGHLGDKIEGAKGYRLKHVICPQDSLDDYLKEQQQQKDSATAEGSALTDERGGVGW